MVLAGNGDCNTMRTPKRAAFHCAKPLCFLIGDAQIIMACLACRKGCEFENAETLRFLHRAPKSRCDFSAIFWRFFCDFCSKTSIYIASTGAMPRCTRTSVREIKTAQNIRFQAIFPSDISRCAGPRWSPNLCGKLPPQKNIYLRKKNPRGILFGPIATISRNKLRKRTT